MVMSIGRLCYPAVCAVCGKELILQENTLCLPCFYDMPKTYHWQLLDNPLYTSFASFPNLAGAAAFLFFRETSPYRKLLHMFKYNGISEIGLYMGRLFGKELIHYYGTRCFCKEGTSPVLIPVPMSSVKRRKRGYNQAEWLAAGLSAATGWPVDVTAVARVTEKRSQTVFDKQARQENMKGSFLAKHLPYDEIILVDDVITTGATMESCAGALRDKNPRVTLAFASLAYVE